MSGWFIIKVDKSDDITVVTKLYKTPEEAIDSILPQIFENLWIDTEEISHRRGGGLIKLETEEGYKKGYVNGLYPLYGINYTRLPSLTHDEMIDKILKDKYLENMDPDTYHVDEYYLKSIQLG